MDLKSIRILGTWIFMIALSGQVMSQQPFKTEIKVDIYDEPVIAKKIETNVSQFFFALSKAFYATNKTNRKINYTSVSISQEAKKMLDTIFKTNPFRCKDEQLMCEGLMLGSGTGYEIRNIPVIDIRNEVHQIILDFDNGGFITDILFSIDSLVYEIPDISKEIDNKRVSIIKTFLENFRTAYNRKDIQYLKQLFSDDALIITGKVLRNMNQTLYDVPQEIVYKVQKKDEYFASLSSVFQKNEYINIKLDSIQIVKHDTYGDYFGVSVKQLWNSTNYNDIGYVFLLIQFRNENDENPIIHLRAWQPARRFGIYSLDIEPNRHF